MEELLEVLWAYRTTARRPTGISPFALTYGIDAIIPMEIGMPTLRTDMPKQSNTEFIIKELNTTDELRETAAIRIASYHHRLANISNRRVKPRVFQPGNLVLRKIFENTTDPMAGKFQANWEGPYIVKQVGKSESYALDKLDGTHVPRLWNVMHLRRYYQ